jgi:hypothetical protein
VPIVEEYAYFPSGTDGAMRCEEEEEEERSLIKDLKRYAQLAVAWDRHGFLVPRWT